MQLAHRAKRRLRSYLGTGERLINSLAGWLRVAMVGLTTVLGVASLVGPAAAQAPSKMTNYSFRTLNNVNDPTFNQLLGINQRGIIAGYFGSGAAGHPNKGYVLFPRHGQYLNENFPGSLQTQLTGLNDRGVTVGFGSFQNNPNNTGNPNFGFYTEHGRFHDVNFPGSTGIETPVNQLLGVNDFNLAVGFYTDANGNNHGYTYNIRPRAFRQIDIPGATSTTTTAINNLRDIAGFETDAMGNQDGFLIQRDGKVTTLDVPGASATMALGVNDQDEVVGVYIGGSGATAVMHGFTWTPWNGFQTVDDPLGIGTTTINGVNDEGQLVGFYVDANGNTDGLLATPAGHHHNNQ